MKYVVEVNGATHAARLGADGVSFDGKSLTVHLEGKRAGTPIRLLRIGNKIYSVLVRPQSGRGRYTLWIDGYRYEVEALDERTRAIRDMAVEKDVAAGPAPLLAPMPGLVVRVTVSVGDAVSAGQGLVVIEAMKMENELRAKSSGRVKAVLVEAGVAVEKGAILVELE